MKKHLTKVLSFVLCLAMLLSVCIFVNAENAVAEGLEKDTNGNYVIYVSLAGSDAESDTMGTKTNPLLTVNAAITLVNSLGLKEGDNATVKIITTTETDTAFNYVTYANTQSHSATITYTSASDAPAYLSCDPTHGASNKSLWVHGPSVFKNLKLIDQRNDGSTRGIYLQGHDTTFEDVTHYRLKSKTDDTLVSKKADVYLYVNRTASGAMGVGNTFTVNDGSTLKSVCLGSFTDSSSANFVFANDSTLISNGGTIPTVSVGSMKAGTSTFSKNANVVLNNGADVTNLIGNYSTGGTINVNGGVQVVANYGSEIGSVDLTTITGDSYILKVKSEDISLDITANTGKYSVTGTKLAYAVKQDGRTVYYSADGVLSTTKGTYDVYSADSVEAILSALSAPIPDSGYRFDGWDTTAAGVIKAKFVADGTVPENPKYYVQYGGTGNGLSPESPVGTVKDAVTIINEAGYDADDTVEVYIMNDTSLPADKIQTVDGVVYDDFYWYDADGNFVKDVVMNDGSAKNIKGRFTPWAEKGGSAGTYTATLVFKGYTEDAYLAQAYIIGYNANFTLGGPTVFEDIRLLTNRKNDRELFIDGNNVTFNNAPFYYVNADNSSKSGGYTGIFAGHQRVVLSGSSDNKTIANDMTVTVNTTVQSESDTRYGYQIPGAKATTFDGNVKLYFNGASSKNGAIAWGQSASTFNKGLSFVVNGGTYAAKLRSTVYDLTVNGGLQVVANNGCALMPIPSCVKADKTWYMSSAATDGSALDVTNTAGTFKVIGGKTAKAVDSEGYAYLSADGLLTVPEGTYTVTYTDAEVSEGTLYLDGEEYCKYIKGAVVALPTPDKKPGLEFSGWGIEGDLYKDYYQTKETDDTVSLTSQYDPIPDTCVYYVDQTNGMDTNDGTATDKALATLDAAITLADANAKSNKLIVIIGSYGIEKDITLAAHNNMVVITGDYTGNTVFKKGNGKYGNISINGPTTFENIAFVNYVNSKFIDTASHKLVIGENVTFKGGTLDGKTYSSSFDLHVGVMDKNATARETIEINSPVGLAYVGTFYNSKNRTFKGADITVRSTISNLRLSADGWGSETNIHYLPSEFEGVTNIIIEGDGKIGTISSISDRRVYSDKTAFNFLYTGKNVPPVSEGVLEYSWIIDASASTETEYITPTDKIGIFNVSGDKTALAVSSEGSQIISIDGVLTIPGPGKYTISYEDEVPYTNSGLRVDFYKDTTIELSNLVHKEQDGKMFIGWLDEEGNAPEDNSFTAGDALIAQYTDLDIDTEFFIEGAQIRTTGKKGLRFIINKKATVDEKLPNIESYGSVVLPYYYLYNFAKLTNYPLELDTTYTADGKQYASKDVPAEKLFSKDEEGVKYTVCITGVAKKYYDRMYAVRGYIKYKDLNGYDKILYTDLYATRDVNIAETILRDAAAGKTTITDTEKAYYENIISTSKAIIAEDFSGEQVTVGGDPNDENSFKHVYEIEGNGLQVREVNIYPNDYVEGETEREPLVVVQTSDLHFNYVSEEDFKEANPSIMSTYKGRTAFRDTVPAAINALRYAYTADAMVTTGDVIDFLSLGSMELTKKYLFDTYPYMLASLGNHEGTRVCQQPEGEKAPDPTTLESRHEILQTIWNSDIFYSSQLVGDRVLLIQLEDGTASTFWDVQVEPFKADLELAREKGYTVLLFFHIPLRTYNPNETAVDQLENTTGRSDKSGVRNFTTEGIGRATDASKAIFGLIAENSDIIKGMFTCHTHSPYYSEFAAEIDENGVVTKVVPQYTMTATAYGKGSATKIIIH